MADRYWVGGNGSWTSADTTHWSASSGGAGGASVPDAATDVHFDTNSTTSVVTLTGALNCLSLICEGTFTGRFTSTGTIAIAGSLTYIAGMGTNNNTGTYTFTSTTTGRTITSAGKTLPACTFDGVGGGWTLADAVSAASRTWTFLNGAFSTGNQTMAIGAIVSNNSNVRSISLGSSTITLSGVSTAIQFGTTAAELIGLTFNAGTSTLILITNGTTSNTLRMNGQTYYNFTIGGTSTGAAAFSNSTGNVTFNRLSWARTNNGGSVAFTGILPDPLDPRAYYVADWDVSGVAGGTIMINSASAGIAVNLVYTGVGVINVRNLAVRDIAATPANTWFDRGLPVAQMDLGGNTGWIFSARRILTATRTVATTRTPAIRNYVTRIITDDPVSYWRLGEASGTVAADEMGVHAGAYVASPTLGVTGAILNDSNTAITVNGTTQYMTVPFAADLNGAVFSVEAWAYPTGGAGAFRGVIGSRFFPNGWIIYAADSDVWQFWINDGVGMAVLAGPAVALNTWAHMVGTFDGTTARFYVNGNPVASATPAYTPQAIAALTIGLNENGGAFPFVGRLDEAAVYGTVLTAAQVQLHYALGRIPAMTARTSTG